ncbi:hypothetical protein, partial [Pseudomonas gingeri]|uniref:hypothetical protein n=1 Tax=Pseudomonas gingeri TaxID=117681 RepID=UPI001AE0811C
VDATGFSHGSSQSVVAVERGIAVVLPVYAENPSRVPSGIHEQHLAGDKTLHRVFEGLALRMPAGSPASPP